MPYVIAFPSLALISAHDLPGSSSIEPKGAEEIIKERSFNWVSDLRAKQFYAEQSSKSQRKYGESNATNGIGIKKTEFCLGLHEGHPRCCL